MERLGEFELLETLSARPVSTVYRARRGPGGPEVALRVLNVPSGKEGQALASRFLEEAQLALRVQSPRAVQVLGTHVLDGRPALELEYVPGGPLAELLKQRPLSIAEAVRLLHDALTGLAAIHAAGLVNRDVRPANVLLDGGGGFKVGDFGLLLDSGRRPTLRAGATQYMAPEALQEPFQFDKRVDLYGLGMTVYEALLGPRFAETFADVTAGGGPAADRRWVEWACGTAAAPALHELRPDVPPGLARLVARLMAKPLAERAESAEAALVALADPALQAPAAAPAWSPPPPPRARGKGLPPWAIPTAISVTTTALILAVGLRGGPVAIEVDTVPTGAAVRFEGQTLKAPARLEPLDRSRKYDLDLWLPGFHRARVSLDPGSGPGRVSYRLEEDCGGGEGLAAARVRVKAEAGADHAFLAALAEAAPFAVLVGPSCDADASLAVAPELRLVDAQGQATGEPIRAQGEAARGELAGRLQALYLKRVLTMAPSPPGAAVLVSRSEALAPEPAQSLRAGVDALAYWVQSPGLERLLLLEVSPQGQLFVVFPNRYAPGGAIRPTGWTRFPTLGQATPEGRALRIPVSPPAGPEHVVAVVFGAASGIGALDQRFPGLWSGPAAGLPYRVLEGATAREFAEAVAERLQGPGWARAAFTFRIEP